MKNQSPLKFPCVFPIKVMGLNSEAFAAAVLSIAERHIGAEKMQYSRRLSSGDKYCSFTITFTAQNRAQVDAIYQELNSHDLVMMTL